MRVNYNLKTPAAKESLIQLKFTYNKVQYRISTGLKVDPEKWNKDNQRVRGRSKDADELNEKLRVIFEGVMNFLRQLPGAKARPVDEVKMRVKSLISHAIGGYYLRESMKPVDPSVWLTPSNLPPAINDAIQAYIDKNKLTLSDGRQRHYRSCKNILNEHRLGLKRIDQWDVSTFERFRDGLIEKGKRNDTILAKINMVKAVLRNINASHPALAFKFTTDSKHDQPTLTEGELIQLREATLPADVVPTRDLFLFQCCTGQRISDVMTLRMSNIHLGIWTVNQKKTDKLVKIPLNTEALSILEKYEFTLPKCSAQHHNRNLKDMALLAKLTRVVHIQRKSGNRVIDIEEPIHKLIASHMARRIFITHNLNAGRPINLIARITGQTIDTLQKYEQAGEEALKNFW